MSTASASSGNRLSPLAFERRSEADKAQALTRVRDDGTRVDTAAAEAGFEKDMRLIIHSPAFRRQGKQTMIAPSDSHMFQNRLSHSLTVAETGVLIAEKLDLGGASKALIRAIAYTHDIGHPPFSHEGEEAINTKLREHGVPWDHDSSGLDVLLNNSLHGLGYHGLPLTGATVEGIGKRYKKERDSSGTWRFNHVEGQVAAVADWIAVTATDIEDMMLQRANTPQFSKDSKAFFDDMAAHFPLAKEIQQAMLADLRERAPGEHGQWVKRTLDERLPTLVHQFCEQLTERLVDDTVANANRLLGEYSNRLRHAEDVRDLPELIVTPSPAIKAQLDGLKAFYQERIYPEIASQHLDTVALVSTVFDDFTSGAVAMPDGWDEQYRSIRDSQADTAGKRKQMALLVADYMTTNMTDRDVLWHLREHHPEEAIALLDASQKAPYPTTPPAAITR